MRAVASGRAARKPGVNQRPSVPSTTPAHPWERTMAMRSSHSGPASGRDAAGGVGDHQPLDALRRLQREVLADHAAHREAEEVRAPDLQRIEQAESGRR
jgi:hypothetical protein